MQPSYQKQEKKQTPTQQNKFSVLMDQTADLITLPQSNQPAVAVNLATNGYGKKKVSNGDKQASQLAGGGKHVSKK